MNETEARDLLASARVARLATVGAGGHPHLVPICFALDRDALYTAIDHKPKRTRSLRRLANITANPWVAVLADHYEEDWARLWWVRADGRARLSDPGTREHSRGVELLATRYDQYRQRPPDGPTIVLEIESWRGWRAADG